MKKNIVIFSILILIFLLGLFFSLFFGIDSDNKNLILSYIRVPNTIKAVVAGSSLALAGMVLQAISKNPLADPYLTGLSSGAGLGIALSVLYFSSVEYSLFGFVGALVAAILVICLSGFSKFSLSKLILIGLSINIFTSSIIAFLILANPEKAYAMTLILSGGFSNADVSNRLLLLMFVLAIGICLFLIPKLNLMRIDSLLVFDTSQKLIKYNIIFVILSAFLTSLAVFSAGILGFVGIIVPHLAKMMVGNDYRRLFFANILLGGTLLLISNLLSTHIMMPLQIPLGIVIAFIGAPLFIFFLLRRDFE